MNKRELTVEKLPDVVLENFGRKTVVIIRTDWEKTETGYSCNVSRSIMSTEDITDDVVSKMNEDPGAFYRAITAKNLQGEYEKAVDEWMDKAVQKKGYTNLLSCVSYKDSTDEIFRKEGMAASVWRDKVYRAMYNSLNDYISGKIELPTISEFTDTLPPLPEELM